ncbi:FAD-dependent oxidoreductase [Patescibacteria group bacterium]|nr:FAD-dependent oxidoreductase [Patescibacteria group bacterium]MBU0964032.1 FAD-dependent oxidoreductase [Patescibacteria group bacterium]
MVYDVIIIGGAAAGLTAALYTSRRAMKTLVVSQDIGGQALLARDIENYPGLLYTSGAELMQLFYKQAKKSGAEFLFNEVKQIKKTNGIFEVITNTKESQAYAIILAFGLTHRHLDVPGEKKFSGQGVSYCATCDAPLYKDKSVAVVGHGEAAYEAAILLSKYAKKVYLIYRQEALRGNQVLIEKINKSKPIDIKYGAMVLEIIGQDKVVGIAICQVKNQTDKEELKVDGVFVEIGFLIKSDLVKGLVDLDSNNQIVITKNCATSTPGIFAAGDATNIEYKQIIVSAGEGAKAGMQAYKFLNNNKSGGVGVDWGINK